MISVGLLLTAVQVLTLSQAESNTHANLPALRLAAAQTAAQRAVRDEAFSAYLPQLSASTAYYPTILETGAAAASAGANIPSAAFSRLLTIQATIFGVAASQLIYDFNQTLDRIKSGDAFVVAQRENESIVWTNALVMTRAAYFNCQQNLQLIQVAQENLDDQNRHVSEMAAGVKFGTRPPIDLAQAQQQAAEARYLLIQARGNYLVSKAALEQAMGINAAPDFEVSADVFPPVPGEELSTDALLPEAIAARPEIVTLEDQLKAQRLLVSANRESWAPSLSAVASGGGFWGASEGASGTTPTARIGLSLEWPFWLGGIAQAATRQAEAVLVQLQAQTEAEKQQIRNDVDTARIAVETAKGQLGAAQEALSYAREQLKLAEGEYAAGIAIALYVFDAAVAVFNAGGQAAQSVDALATGRAQLLRALGRESAGERETSGQTYR